MPTVDRRRDPRFPMQCPVRLLAGNGQRERRCLTFNVSRSGLGLISELPLAQGAQLGFAINVRDLRRGEDEFVWVEFTARVVHVVLSGDLYRVGLEFVHFAGEGARIFRQALDYHVKLHGLLRERR